MNFCLKIMQTVYEHEDSNVSCSDMIVYFVRRILNLQASSVKFYIVMNRQKMKDILNEMRIA